MKQQKQQKGQTKTGGHEMKKHTQAAAEHSSVMFILFG